MSIDNFEELKNYLLDRESKEVFDARIDYMQTKDTVDFIRKMLSFYKFFRYPALDNFLENRKSIQLVIFGAGYEGGIAAEILYHTKYAASLYAFCDNNKELWGKKKCGLPIMSIYELLTLNREMVFVLASSTYNQQFLIQLISLGVLQKNIFIPQWGGFLFAERGRQYFDVFQPCEHEVFVDAGAFDGNTSKEFIKWCDEKYCKIFMFEINANMENICFMNLGTKKGVRFKAKGVWSEDTYLKFYDSQSNSRVEEISQESREINLAQVCAIDSELKEEKITFIKMDVEGSELKALEGAQNTIKKLKPKLAISVYHKLDDVIDIMKYLIKLNPQYRFYLRHYWACQCETVLYAISL